MVLLNLVETWLIFTAEWTTAWNHGVRDTSVNTHLQSFDSSIAAQAELPSLKTPK